MRSQAERGGDGTVHSEFAEQQRRLALVVGQLGEIQGRAVYLLVSLFLLLGWAPG